MLSAFSPQLTPSVHPISFIASSRLETMQWWSGHLYMVWLPTLKRHALLVLPWIVPTAGLDLEPVLDKYPGSGCWVNEWEKKFFPSKISHFHIKMLQRLKWSSPCHLWGHGQTEPGDLHCDRWNGWSFWIEMHLPERDTCYEVRPTLWFWGKVWSCSQLGP